MSHPFGESPWYGTGFAAVRFNLDDKGTGPVSGFEQVRSFAGLGCHVNPYVQLEFGYLYRYERKRDVANLSDHAIHLQLVINTGRRTPKPNPRPHYR
jgi:hypothetical protein